jgi:hypothetical protein
VYDDHIGMWQIVLAKGAHSWTEDRLGVCGWCSGVFRQWEAFLDTSHEFIMVDVTSCNQVDVGTDIVTVVVVLDHISSDRLHVADVP